MTRGETIDNLEKLRRKIDAEYLKYRTELDELADKIEKEKEPEQEISAPAPIPYPIPYPIPWYPNSGWRCPYCHRWIPWNIYHTCPSWYPEPMKIWCSTTTLKTPDDVKYTVMI